MFFRLLAFFALVAVALATPKPEPQLLTYGAAPVAYSAPAYSALTYSAPYAAYPYAYSGYYVR